MSNALACSPLHIEVLLLSNVKQSLASLSVTFPWTESFQDNPSKPNHKLWCGLGVTISFAINQAWHSLSAYRTSSKGSLSILLKNYHFEPYRYVPHLHSWNAFKYVMSNNFFWFPTSWVIFIVSHIMAVQVLRYSHILCYSCHIRWHIFWGIFTFQEKVCSLVMLGSSTSISSSVLNKFRATRSRFNCVLAIHSVVPAECISAMSWPYGQTPYERYIIRGNIILLYFNIPFLRFLINKFANSHVLVQYWSRRTSQPSCAVRIQGSSHTLTSYLECIFCLIPNRCSFRAAEILVHT